MSSSGPRTSISPPDPVEVAVKRLQGSGLSEDHLRWGARLAAAKGLPLRDSIVLREAGGRAEIDTERARDAWAACRGPLEEVLPDSTYRLWVEPLQVIGEHENRLVLAGPRQVHVWVERRYPDLLNRTVATETDFDGIRFARIFLEEPPRELAA